MVTPAFSTQRCVCELAQGGLWSLSTLPTSPLPRGRGPCPWISGVKPGFEWGPFIWVADCQAVLKLFQIMGFSLEKNLDGTERKNTGIDISSYSITQRGWILTLGFISFWSFGHIIKSGLRENIPFCVPINFNPTEGGGRFEKMGII